MKNTVDVAFASAKNAAELPPCSTDLAPATGEEDLVVRRVHGGDLKSVASLLTHLGYPLTPDGLREVFQTIVYDPQVSALLACLDHAPVGLITVRVFHSLRLNGLQASIEELVVHPMHRGKGIGRTLLAKAVECAKDRGAVRLEVHTSHKMASFKRRFYEKNGFLQAQSTLYRMELQGESQT